MSMPTRATSGACCEPTCASTPTRASSSAGSWPAATVSAGPRTSRCVARIRELKAERREGTVQHSAAEVRRRSARAGRVAAAVSARGRAALHRRDRERAPRGRALPRVASRGRTSTRSITRRWAGASRRRSGAQRVHFGRTVATLTGDGCAAHERAGDHAPRPARACR